jgi:hypothetical protein
VRISSPFDLTGRSDLRFEHQVELDWGGQLVTSLRVDNVVFLDDLAELGPVKVVDLWQIDQHTLASVNMH